MSLWACMVRKSIQDEITSRIVDIIMALHYTTSGANLQLFAFSTPGGETGISKILITMEKTTPELVRLDYLKNKQKSQKCTLNILWDKNRAIKWSTSCSNERPRNICNLFSRSFFIVRGRGRVCILQFFKKKNAAGESKCRTSSPAQRI